MKSIALCCAIFPQLLSSYFFLVIIRDGLLGYLQRTAVLTDFFYVKCTGEVWYLKKALIFWGVHAHT